MKTTEALLPESLAQSVVSMIRQESRTGRLIADTEIFRRLSDSNRSSLQAEECECILKKATDEEEDLGELVAGDGSRHYYSSQFMTGSYALILLERQGDPLRLIANSVRKNSADYPRPVPLNLFTQAPFDFTLRDVQDILERMSALEEFRDIARTTTSASSVFLYSTLYLEPGHASMLAEWLDVGQCDNP
jgi:hypothetical protein